MIWFLEKNWNWNKRHALLQEIWHSEEKSNKVFSLIGGVMQMRNKYFFRNFFFIPGADVFQFHIMRRLYFKLCLQSGKILWGIIAIMINVVNDNCGHKPIRVKKKYRIFFIKEILKICLASDFQWYYLLMLPFFTRWFLGKQFFETE